MVHHVILLASNSYEFGLHLCGKEAPKAKDCVLDGNIIAGEIACFIRDCL